MNKLNIEPLESFEIWALDRVTGKARSAKVSAPSLRDAEDYVQDMQPDWIVRFPSSCDHCEEIFPEEELTSCAVEPDFRFCDTCIDKLS